MNKWFLLVNGCIYSPIECHCNKISLINSNLASHLAYAIALLLLCWLSIVFLQETLDIVETLLKKHEAFERSASTQEERFNALERLTTVCKPFVDLVLKPKMHNIQKLK